MHYLKIELSEMCRIEDVTICQNTGFVEQLECVENTHCVYTQCGQNTSKYEVFVVCLGHLLAQNSQDAFIKLLSPRNGNQITITRNHYARDPRTRKRNTTHRGRWLAWESAAGGL